MVSTVVVQTKPMALILDELPLQNLYLLLAGVRQNFLSVIICSMFSIVTLSGLPCAFGMINGVDKFCMRVSMDI